MNSWRACSKLREMTGQSLVEMALVLPLLVMFTLGIVDVSRALQADNAIVNISREGANLASRTTLMREDNGPQLVMNSLAKTEKSLPMKKRGMMYITEVENVSGAPSIKEQYPWDQNPRGPRSKVSSDTLPKILGNIKLNIGDKVWICEVFYAYDSIFVPECFTADFPQLHSLAIL